MITLAAIGLYTLVIISLIHYYEDKLNKNNKPLNAQHYTYLQLENKKLLDQIRQLDGENKVLANLMHKLKEEIAYFRNVQNSAGSQGIQYESSVYKNNTWDVHINFNQDEIDFEQ